MSDVKIARNLIPNIFLSEYQLISKINYLLQKKMLNNWLVLKVDIKVLANYNSYSRCW